MNVRVSRPQYIADLASGVLAGVAAWWWLVARPTPLFNTLAGVLSPVILLYLALSIQIVRHLMWPAPSILTRLAGWHASVIARPHLDAAWRAFVATRPAIFAVAVAAVITIGLPSSPGLVLSRDPVANLPARFDAGWYGGIALDGYTWDHSFQRQRNIAFFPAMPLLMRAAGAVLGMYDETASHDRRMLRALWAGVVISLAAFFWALHYVSRLAADLIGPERAAAAALLLASYPFAFFFNAPYSEAVFLLASVGACYHFLHRDWTIASAWGLLAGLSRPNGCFLSVPLAILALAPTTSHGRSVRASLQKPDFWRMWAAAAMPGVGMLLFTAYLYQLTGGVWFAWARSHEAWGRSLHGGRGVLTDFVGALQTQSWSALAINNPFNAINALGVLFSLLLTYPVFKRLGFAWGVLVLINLLPPLFAGGFLSMGRLTATLFPLFLALAALVPPRSAAAWAAAFGVAQGLGAALFFTWRDLF